MDKLRAEGTATVSFDFGRTFRRASIRDLEGIPIDEIKGNFLYAWDGRDLYKLAIFDKHLYRLRLLAGKPVLEIDGLRMHLVKGFADVLDYSREIARLLRIGPRDTVLDTCTGLGYTAIAASKAAKKVVTIECSRAALKLAEWNPWSRELFHSRNIEIISGDAFEEVPRLEGEFTKIIHDPPRFSRAGELYSAEFYRRLASVSRKGALLFHYFGSPRAGSRDVSAEVKRRLRESGWETAEFHPAVQGCVARKL
ncbi:MAG: methyltransferase [Candidatus Micrarchaeota archaeon]